MQTIYNIIHLYDVDGGIGDAIHSADVLFTTSSRKVAKKFMNQYSNQHIYDTPYDNLYAGELVIQETHLVEEYSDIPVEIIEWGEKNSKKTDYNPEVISSNYRITLEELEELDKLNYTK